MSTIESIRKAQRKAPRLPRDLVIDTTVEALNGERGTVEEIGLDGWYVVVFGTSGWWTVQRGRSISDKSRDQGFGTPRWFDRKPTQAEMAAGRNLPDSTQ